MALHAHAVYSPNALLLSQIACADIGCEHDMHGLHASQSGETAAVAALEDAWSLLQQQKEEAGLAACAAWSCRLFVVPRVAANLHEYMEVAQHSRARPGQCAKVAESETPAAPDAKHREALREVLTGVTLSEVVGLHDGERQLAWALRTVIAQ
jgi:hypothetical protein